MSLLEGRLNPRISSRLFGPVSLSLVNLLQLATLGESVGQPEGAGVAATYQMQNALLFIKVLGIQPEGFALISNLETIATLQGGRHQH